MTFNIPEGVNELNICFVGARSSIERKQRFTFLKVAVNDSAFDREVKTTNFIHFNQKSAAQTLRFPVVIAKQCTVKQSNRTVQNIKSPLKFKTEEFTSEIQHL